MEVLAAIVTLLLLSSFWSCESGRTRPPETPPPFVSPLGKVFTREKASGKLLEQYREAREAYEADTLNADLLIWYGRRTAYLGHFEAALEIYTKGIRNFPRDARMYRHRGHRFISVRKFDEAIADLERAAALIRGTENETEPDGMPNALNIPVSTLHGNIWYHLGLAYYLQGDYTKAYRAYTNCLESGSNPDNLVSSTHWLYMIQRRMGNSATADSLLATVTPELKVIENSSYHNLCLFYKGLIGEEVFIPEGEATAASDAVTYGLANWYYMDQENANKEKGIKLMREIVEGTNWSSFGYIAAESDLLRMETSNK
jgi:tetratricopeptide (TPR) repeat protein